LVRRTISDFRLTTELGLPHHVLRQLPHMTVQLYAPRIGAYDLAFYWDDDALRIARAYHGADPSVSRQELADQVAAAAARRALEAKRTREDTVFGAVLALGVPRKGPFASPAALRRASRTFARACGCDELATSSFDAPTAIEEAVAYDLRAKVLRWAKAVHSAQLTGHPGVAFEHVKRACLRESCLARVAAEGRPNKAFFRDNVWPFVLAEAREQLADWGRCR
jgi:hypothetical protein